MFTEVWYNRSMKTHAIIPIFIPHAGCPHDCVFCSQKAITARSAAPAVEDAEALILRNLASIEANPNIKEKEIAFYGGSFTGIPEREQNAYLKLALKYKKRGRIGKIHLSTRPDYINEKILKNLKEHSVDIIELGVQSFDETVLRKSARGHSAEAVYKGAELIKKYGFTLGIQLMTGLPGDSHASCIYSAEETVKLSPELARIYPTVVIEGTALADMYRSGAYTPPTRKQTLHTVKEMYKILVSAGINVIRIGLKSTDIIKSEDGAVVAGEYHPAFRQLVDSEIARESMLEQLASHGISAGSKGRAEFVSSPVSMSNMIGTNKTNKLYFAEHFPALSIKYSSDKSLDPNVYLLRSITCPHSC